MAENRQKNLVNKLIKGTKRIFVFTCHHISQSLIFDVIFVVVFTNNKKSASVFCEHFTWNKKIDIIIFIFFIFFSI